MSCSWPHWEHIRVLGAQRLMTTTRPPRMPLPAEGLGRVVVIGGGFRVLGLVGIGGRPILPTVRAVQRGREIRAHGLGLFPRLGFLRVQNAQEQNPGQLRHIIIARCWRSLERRITSQMLLTKAERDCVEAMVLGDFRLLLLFIMI
jgi:hypothetical protein